VVSHPLREPKYLPVLRRQRSFSKAKAKPDALRLDLPNY
jgi:hypothetical protein